LIKFTRHFLIPCSIGICFDRSDVLSFAKKHGLHINADGAPKARTFDVGCLDGYGYCVFVWVNLDKDNVKKNQINVSHAYIAHEAVHCVQFLFDFMGDEKPSYETEAYFVQEISYRMFEELDKEISRIGSHKRIVDGKKRKG